MKLSGRIILPMEKMQGIIMIRELSYRMIIIDDVEHGDEHQLARRTPAKPPSRGIGVEAI